MDVDQLFPTRKPLEASRRDFLVPLIGVSHLFTMLWVAATSLLGRIDTSSSETDSARRVQRDDQEAKSTGGDRDTHEVDTMKLG